MRIWMSVAGRGEVAEMMLPVAIGVAIVPAVYLCGARLFSRRTALLAAALAAVSPSLVEYSAQIRPYGLLPLLTLVSCFALVRAIDDGRWTQWAGYVVSTVLLIYTHNWSWLVVGGQVVAVVAISISDMEVRRKLARGVLLSWVVILAAYLPWAATLVFQIRHAGHPPLVVEDWGQAVQLAAFSAPAAIAMVLFGSLPGAGAFTVIAALTVGIGGAVAVRLQGVRSPEKNPDWWHPNTQPPDARTSPTATRVFLIVPGIAIAAVMLLSSRTNLLLPRCLAMLAPLMLLLIAWWVDARVMSAPARNRSTLGAGVVAAAAVISLLGIVSLLRTTRSNVRDVALDVSRRSTPTDLVIIVPEWYAASFNHYFVTAIEQIDYPNDGRGGMVDFSHVFERVADPEPIARLAVRIRDARGSGRRVWLITGRNYLRPVNPNDLARAALYRQSPILSAYRAQQIQHDLRAEFGEPDTTGFVHGNRPRYDDVLAYLYKPPPPTAVKADALQR